MKKSGLSAGAIRPGAQAGSFGMTAPGKRGTGRWRLTFRLPCGIIKNYECKSPEWEMWV
ncbi:hypothetical protein IB211_03128c [Intestinimonas butyriciproducens]|uniref:Uncharacterized protein n=1 Tax=Intestinimonas butyriciproducens TaxID=1297617 RepID=A0A0S2W889_9FIRM|nr:hypothetical protein IB211_03128c [Intestinimonas butyriciproducens]